MPDHQKSVYTPGRDGFHQTPQAKTPKSAPAQPYSRKSKRKGRTRTGRQIT